MKFSIRDLFLAILIVAVCLGWWADHNRMAVRDVKWDESFRNAMAELSSEIGREHTLETPSGLWTVKQTVGAAM